VPFLAKKRKILPYSRARSTKTRIETSQDSYIDLEFILEIREQDPLKQGLKPSLGALWLPACLIREQDPLKQGLKPFVYLLGRIFFSYSRARSTKTRIETLIPETLLLSKSNSRARSTKTRIETHKTGLHPRRFRMIREQDPLKQGLKLIVPSRVIPAKLYSRARSTKTRIETAKKYA